MDNLLNNRRIFAKVLVSATGMKRKPLLFDLIATLVVLLGYTSEATAQQDTIPPQDTTQQKEKKIDTTQVHSPKKAAMYSALLPGLGQAYNQKYWKIPIVYAGFGTLVYFINQNNTEYNKFKDAYAFVIAEKEGNPPNEYVERYEQNADKLRKIKDYYRRNLELSYILTGTLYLLNILDATVDAHFFNFNVDKDLSLKVEPYIKPRGPNPVFSDKGITLTLNF